MSGSTSSKTTTTADPLDRIEDLAIGRRREIEVVLAALSSGGNIRALTATGYRKSTLLRAVGDLLDTTLVFVEGNAELTPARSTRPTEIGQVLSGLAR